MKDSIEESKCKNEVKKDNSSEDNQHLCDFHVLFWFFLVHVSKKKIIKK